MRGMRMNEYFICIAWVTSAFIIHHIGFSRGLKIGKLQERAEWISAGWRFKENINKDKGDKNG